MQRLALLLEAFLLLSAPALLAAARLPMRSWNLADGLPSDEVRTVILDARGFVWAGTTHGLARFDGRSFTVWTERDGLPGRWVQALLEDSSGNLWVGTEAGLCELQPIGEPACREVPLPATRAPPFVGRLFEDRLGRIWAGTHDGLFVAEPSGSARRTFRAIELPAAARFADGRAWIGDIDQEPGGRIWLATAQGLVVMDSDLVPRAVEVDSGAYDRRIMEILVDRKGRLWIAHVDRGLFIWWPPPGTDMPDLCLEALALSTGPGSAGSGQLRLPRHPGEVVLLGQEEGLPETGLRNGLLETASGEIWAGTATSGLCRIANGHLDCFGKESGLPTRALGTAAEDRDGNLWLTSRGAGLVRLGSSRIESFDASDGLTMSRIQALLEDAEGRLIVGATDRDTRIALFRLVAGRFEMNPPRLPAEVTRTAWSRGQVLVPSPAGWWLATQAGVLGWRAGAGFAEIGSELPTVHLTTASGLSGPDTYALLEDHRGSLWIGSWHAPGVARRTSDGRIDRLGSDLGFPEQPALVFAEDRGGGIWIGYADGSLGRAVDDRFEPVLLAHPRDGITTLHVDPLGRLWVGTRNRGALRLDRPEAERGRGTWFGVEEGLASPEVLAIVTEPGGAIYFGGARGLDRWDPATGRLTSITTREGLPDNMVHLLHRDREGAIWVATADGLARLEPWRLPVGRAPELWLTALEVAGRSLPVSRRGQRELGPIRLASDSDLVRAAVAAPSSPRARLEYRLAPGGSWSSLETDSSLVFAGFPQGSHRLEIRNRDAVRVPQLVIHLEVPVRFWRRPSTLTLVLLVLLTLAWAAHRLRLSRLLAVERVRSRLAADLHDDLGASLSRISVLAELARRRSVQPGLDARLAEIAETARSTARSGGDLVWAVDPAGDDPSRLAARLRSVVAEMCEPGEVEESVELLVEGPSDRIALGSELRRNLLLVVKEAVRNAVRHAGPGRVTVLVRLSPDRVSAEITDDGGGFAPDRCVNGELTLGRGLLNMRRRASELGGELAIESSAGSGTRIRFDVPVKRSRVRA